MASTAEVRRIAAALWEQRFFGPSASEPNPQPPVLVTRRPVLETDLAGELNREFYRRGYGRSGRVAKYGSGEGWITIGGSAQGEKQHVGGTPVKLDGEGQIIAGPEKIEGQHIGAIAGGERQPDLFGGRDTRPKGMYPEPKADPQQPLFDKKAGPPKESPGEAKAAEFPGLTPTEYGGVTGVTQAKVGDVVADPKRFQFKISNIDPTTGVNAELKEVKRYNPEFGGQLLVWRDPADGKNYVVNGHHRYELAKRSEYDGPLSVYFINTPTAEKARARGALANIAEGRGTPVDAAKFLRDSGLSIEDLKAVGISLTGSVARDGTTLSKLSDRAFADLARGGLEQGRALAVATHLTDHAMQDKLLADVAAKDLGKGGKQRVSDAAVAEFARERAMAPTRTVQSSDLFGSFEQEESLWLQRAELKAALRKAITDEKVAFRAVSRKGRSDTLATAGNVIDVEASAQRADQAKEALFAFDQLANRKGELSNAINAAALEYAENPRQRKSIERKLIDTARRLLSGEADQGGMAGGGEGRGGMAEVGDSGAARGEEYEFAGAAAGDSLNEEAGIRRFSRQASGRVTLDEACRRELAEQFSRAFSFTTPVAERRTTSTKAAANYRPGFGPVRCASCSHVRKGGKCTLVDGEIRSYDVCDLYMPDRGARAVERYARWDESKHPRGQPKNAGQFAKKETPDDKATAGQAGEPVHPALQGLFTAEETALPPDKLHPHDTEQATYDAAARNEPAYRSILNLGQGVSKDIGATAVEVKSQQDWQDVLERMKSEPGPLVILAPIKGRQRAAEKVLGKYKGQWGKLSDVLRGTIAVDRLEEIPQAVQSLRGHMEKQGWTMAVRPKDRMTNPTTDGYRDQQLVLESPDGMLAELQINLKSMILAKETDGHRLYEQKRSLEEPIQAAGRQPTSEEAAQLADLAQQMRKLYDAAWQAGVS